MAKEHDKGTQELNLTSEWLAIERTRAEAAKASLAAKSAHLNKSECDKLHLLLAHTKCQMEKDLADTQMALGESKARAKAMDDVLGKAIRIKP